MMIFRGYRGALFRKQILLGHILFGIFLLLFMDRGTSCSAAAMGLSSTDLPTWRVLEYRASGIGMSVSVTVQVITEKERAEQGLPGNLSRFDSLLRGFKPFETIPLNMSLFYVRRKVSGFMVSDTVLERFVWFKDDTLEPVARLRWNSRKPDILKFYRWESAGVRRWKLMLDTQHGWRVRDVEHYDFPTGHGCKIFHEPSLLLLLVSQTGPCPQDGSAMLCLFGKKTFHRVHAEFLSSARVAERTCLVNEEDSDLSEPFSLLGLKDEIRLQIDERKVVEKIVGKTSFAGEIGLRLYKIVW